MNLLDGLTADESFTVVGLVVIIFLSGAIAKDEFGLSPSKTGLVVAAIMVVLLVARPLVPQAAPIINLVVGSYGTVLIAFTLAYGTSGVVKRLKERLKLGGQVLDDNSVQERSLTAEEDPGERSWTW